MRISLFIPCFVDQMTPGVGLAVAQVLERLGHSCEFRPAQTCCGQPSFNSGYWDEARAVAIRAVERYSGWLPALECLGFAFALLQLPFTYALIRLDYEQRWYLVTDRSLRIRAGVWNVREMTLSFANIQQITLQQGPLQRLLGLADLVVTTAGGGAPIAGQPGQPSTPWHTGILRAVDNADEIRDLMQERLRQLKSAGTGDHDDAKDALAAVPLPPPHGNVSHDNSLAAARELLREVRVLRNAW